MNIEEKAKAYDEALKKARILVGYPTTQPFISDLQDLFPELKESEDERIRKALVEMVHDTTGDSLWVDYDVHKEDALAWLEKQGEQKFLDDIVKEVTKDKDAAISFLKSTGIINENGELADEYKIEQGEQNTDEYIEVKGLSEIEAEADELIKEMSGEKHNLTDFERTLADICIGWIGEEPGWVEYIKDNADVLLKIAVKMFNSVQDVPFEQKPAPKHKVGDTIYYNSFGKLKSMIVANVVTDSTDNPMYEDKEGNAVFEKDLVEQKPAWSEEDEDILNTIINHFKVDIECTDEDDVIRWLKSIKDRVQPQPKQEWSEENKCMLNNVIDTLKPLSQTTHSGYAINSMINWLKSLKPQSRQEWSVEDDKKLIERLKSLRPQTHWKPSDEQMNILEQWLKDNQYKGDARYCYPIFESLYQDLKKLKG